jgi:hypothetical protein
MLDNEPRRSVADVPVEGTHIAMASAPVLVAQFGK